MSSPLPPSPPPHLLRRSFWTDERSVLLGWCLWSALAIVITITVLRGVGSVTQEYRHAAQAFVRGEPMYSPGAMGWLYPVQSAMVFLPFAFEPTLVFEVAWRLVGIFGLAFAVRSLTLNCGFLQAGPEAPRHNLFFVVTIFALPTAAGAASNGQINLHLTVILALACVCVMKRRWWWATFWLALAVAAKPVAVVVLLLYLAVHRPLWWRLPIGLAVVAAMPFLNPNWEYVREQYIAGLHKVVEAGTLRDASVFIPADLTSLLDLLGMHPSNPVLMVIRGVMAFATLGLSGAAVWLFDRRTSAVLVTFLGMAYLMVFNPRTEGNTYVLLGVPLAMITGWSLVERRASPRSVLLVIACIVMGYAQFFVPDQREYWIRPGETIALMALLGAALLSSRWRKFIPTALGQTGSE